MKEKVERAGQATILARDRIAQAEAVLAEAVHANALGILIDPGASLLALETAQARIAEAMKVITETEWPRDADYE
ncbi:MAG: hypothetical protein APF80_12450 [Alphaproteobacteria bacterium BRH_c36]|nr:MAG: hypothetical protein APF80_12450 [Alphaproteobacteria bacterium BRH_c36]